MIHPHRNFAFQICWKKRDCQLINTVCCYCLFMPAPQKKPWTLRNPQKWGRYAQRCGLGASKRKVLRQTSSTKGRRQELILSISRFAEKARHEKVPRFDRKVIVNIIADTALKCSGAKSFVLAKDYQKLAGLIKQYLSGCIARNDAKCGAALLGAVELFGEKNTRRVFREVENLQSIVSDWIE